MKKKRSWVLILWVGILLGGWAVMRPLRAGSDERPLRPPEARRMERVQDEPFLRRWPEGLDEDSSDPAEDEEPETELETFPLGRLGRSLRSSGTPGLFELPEDPPGPGAVLDRWVPRLLRTPDRKEQAGLTVLEVQRAAVRYAEVQPEKITQWRRQARWRAFFPKLTLGIDQDTDSTIASATASGKTTFSVGPKDRRAGVSLGFTWELGDFIWNPAQTSIDVRSRLMVLLRQRLLEEVTRVYFERQRLCSEFEAHPADDPQLRRERDLRIEELSAHLDALTGGWYSEQLR